MSRLNDSAQGGWGSYFQAQVLYLYILEQARVLKLGKYVHLGVINTIYKHAVKCRWRINFWGIMDSISQLGTRYEVKIMQLCSFSIHK